MLQIVVICYKVCLGFLKKQTQRQGFAWKWPWEMTPGKGKMTQEGRKKIKGVSLNKIHVSKKGSVPLRNPRRQCRPHLTSRLRAERFIFPNPMLTV